jgi:hypothetical protein
MPTTTVRGRVHLDGKPIIRGWIEIAPCEGTMGRITSAPIAPDGSFVAEKVPVGHVVMHFSGPPAPSTGDRAMDLYLFRAHREPVFRREISPGVNPRMDLDLRAEKARFEQVYGRIY